MAELPERRVLKEVLSDLKAKTLKSQNRAANSASNLLTLMDKINNTIGEYAQIQKGTANEKAADAIHTGVMNMISWVIDVLQEYSSASDDMNIYVRSLEKYSIELDKTLYDAIEEGKKKGEEQIKEQNELMKRKTDDYVK